MLERWQVPCWVPVLAGRHDVFEGFVPVGVCSWRWCWPLAGVGAGVIGHQCQGAGDPLNFLSPQLTLGRGVQLAVRSVSVVCLVLGGHLVYVPGSWHAPWGCLGCVFGGVGGRYAAWTDLVWCPQSV